MKLIKDAMNIAHQIIDENSNTRQAWLEEYGRMKMVIVPMDVLSSLLLFAEDNKKLIVHTTERTMKFCISCNRNGCGDCCFTVEMNQPSKYVPLIIKYSENIKIIRNKKEYK